MSDASTWWACGQCDVRWWGHDTTCWSCTGVGVRGLSPAIGSQMGIMLRPVDLSGVR